LVGHAHAEGVGEVVARLGGAIVDAGDAGELGADVFLAIVHTRASKTRG
jgi:hypothetical protein